MVRRANGTIEEIGEDIAGFPLGIIPDSNYKQTEIHLHPGRRRASSSPTASPTPATSARSCTNAGQSAADRRVAETAGRPRDVGRAILQDIREFSAGHAQVDDITLICFGPVAA